MSGMYFDDARGLRQGPVSWHSPLQSNIRIYYTLDDSQEKEQEMEANAGLPSILGLGPL